MGVFTTAGELAAIRTSGRIVSEALDEVAAAVKPGVTTAALDAIAERAIVRRGGTPAFKGYRGFQHALCTSMNDEVVHGIPSPQRALQAGDIVGLDLGVIYQGFYTDHAATVPVGEVDVASQKLIAASREALTEAIKLVSPSLQLGTLGARIQATVERHGFAVVRDLVGHGLGRQLHEEPKIPNFGEEGTGAFLKPGMLIAIEPMVTAGKYPVQLDDDGWTVRTADGSRSAHFEQTVLVTNGRPEIITPYGPHLKH
ncbi:MAG: type I methionyl aminopeptidase [Candidatus Kerfeldbacteria bacterium]|nr:type I methionyl aminopeptidase [Candidatus Kerfeldbacteria bacterium]